MAHKIIDIGGTPTCTSCGGTRPFSPECPPEMAMLKRQEAKEQRLLEHQEKVANKANIFLMFVILVVFIFMYMTFDAVRTWINGLFSQLKESIDGTANKVEQSTHFMSKVLGGATLSLVSTKSFVGRAMSHVFSCLKDLEENGFAL
jgi:hypothetical protein